MRPIDFCIVGAQKSGTTTLYDWLGQHPDVFVPHFKEVLYFADDELYAEGETYLERFFREAKEERVRGLAYVHMLRSQAAIERCYAHNPSMKIIAVLRNPIDRAYSAFWFAKRSGWEDSDTFEAALAAEKIRAIGTRHQQTELTYVDHGDYAAQLERWIAKFGRDNVHVVLTDDIIGRPQEALTGALAFLGLDPSTAVKVDTSRKKNESAMPKYPWLQKFLLSHEGWHKRLARQMIPSGVRYVATRHVFWPMSHWNLKPFKYPKMSEETRRQLAEHYAPRNARLGEIIGRDLSHWK